jgi:sirohydrochlorin ferrochelatase
LTRSDSALLLVTHGTRDEAGLVAARRLAARVRERLPTVNVRLAFADVRPPSVIEALPELMAGLGVTAKVVVLPVFLASGYHVRVDLPEQLARAGASHRVQLASALGPQPVLIRAAAERLRGAGWRRGDSVVLGAAGSTDLGARREVEWAARGLGRLLGSSVRVGYLAGPQPRLEHVVRESRAVTSRVAVASWLLGPGYFQNRLADAQADVWAAPLAGHQAVVDAVLTRYRQALGCHAEAA